MTDPTEFSVEMSVNPANPFKPLSDQVAFDLCHAYPLADGNLLLLNTRNGKRAKVKPEVYASTLKCLRIELAISVYSIEKFLCIWCHNRRVISMDAALLG